MKTFFVLGMGLLLSGLSVAGTSTSPAAATDRSEYKRIVTNKLKQWDHIISQLEHDKKNDGSKIKADADINRREIAQKLRSEEADARTALKEIDNASVDGMRDVQKRVQSHLDNMRDEYKKVAAE